jgi:hypothetical protein
MQFVWAIVRVEVVSRLSVNIACNECVQHSIHSHYCLVGYNIKIMSRMWTQAPFSRRYIHTHTHTHTGTSSSQMQYNVLTPQHEAPRRSVVALQTYTLRVPHLQLQQALSTYRHIAVIHPLLQATISLF